MRGGGGGVVVGAAFVALAAAVATGNGGLRVVVHYFVRGSGQHCGRRPLNFLQLFMSLSVVVLLFRVCWLLLLLCFAYGL